MKGCFMLRSHVQEGWARPKQQWGWGGRKLNLGAPHGWLTKRTLRCMNREWESSRAGSLSRALTRVWASHLASRLQGQSPPLVPTVR